jgi:hypothetical protein
MALLAVKSHSTRPTRRAHLGADCEADATSDLTGTKASTAGPSTREKASALSLSHAGPNPAPKYSSKASLSTLPLFVWCQKKVCEAATLARLTSLGWHASLKTNNLFSSFFWVHILDEVRDFSFSSMLKCRLCGSPIRHITVTSSVFGQVLTGSSGTLHMSIQHFARNWFPQLEEIFAMGWNEGTLPC